MYFSVLGQIKIMQNKNYSSDSVWGLNALTLNCVIELSRRLKLKKERKRVIFRTWLILCKLYRDVLALIELPEPDHPLRTDIAQEYLKDHKKFMKNAEEFTKKHSPRAWVCLTCLFRHFPHSFNLFQINNLFIFLDLVVLSHSIRTGTILFHTSETSQ